MCSRKIIRSHRPIPQPKKRVGTAVMLAAGGVVVATLFATVASMLAATGHEANPERKAADVVETITSVAPDGSTSTVWSPCRPPRQALGQARPGLRPQAGRAAQRAAEARRPGPAATTDDEPDRAVADPQQPAHVVERAAAVVFLRGAVLVEHRTVDAEQFQLDAGPAEALAPARAASRKPSGDPDRRSLARRSLVRAPGPRSRSSRPRPRIVRPLCDDWSGDLSAPWGRSRRDRFSSGAQT